MSRAAGEDTPTFGRSDLSFNSRRCTETAESSSGGRSRHAGQALLPLACTHGSDIAPCGEGFTASKAQPIAAFSSRDNALQPTTLLDAPEFLDPPTFFEDRMSAAPAGNAEHEDSPSPEASFRRVRCCLLRFQARPQFCTLWAAAHEDVLAFASRASIIIINPAPQSFNVVLADPQPTDSLLAFLLVPIWWVSSGITPFTVTATMPGVPFYLQVAREQEDFEDWIPTTALRSFGTLIAQLYEGRSNTRIREDPFPCVGSLLVVVCLGGEDSEIVSAQQVLDLLPHVPAEDAALHAALPERNDVLLLGVAFEQSLVRMPIGVLFDEVAAFAGIEQEPYHVHWLTDFFEDLAYEGHSVDRCVACRPAAFRSRRPEACGLFIDGRLLGRPVCYRSSHTPLLEAGDLLRLIHADLPPGFELRVIGGTTTSDPDVFRFEDGARVVLWAASLAAAGVTEAEATEVADHSPVPDSAGSPSDARGCISDAASRSRSPRRGPSGGNSEGPTVALDNDAVNDCAVPFAVEGDKWKRWDGPHACLPCTTSDTPVCLLMPADGHVAVSASCRCPGDCDGRNCVAKSIPADGTAGKGSPFNTPRAACDWDEHFSVDPVGIGAATVLRS